MIHHLLILVNTFLRYNIYMNILISTGWDEYALLDSGNQLRFEKFGPYKIVRPDPQAIWQPILSQDEWEKADVRFVRTTDDKGEWKFKNNLPEKWLMRWRDISFWVRLTSFKHTGVFPEQSLQWEWIQDQIKFRLNSENQKESVTSDNQKTTESSDILKHRISSESHPNILNLFAYTGIASLVAANAGATVTHVDASKPSITWARENQEASKLSDKPIRWILDDCVKFVEREIRRGNTYDGIIMDPPVYGHGPDGQIWKFNDNFPALMANVTKLLSKNPLFVIVNAYAISSSSLMLQNVLEDNLKNLGGKIEVGELALKEMNSDRLLSTGIFGRWSR